MVLEYNSEGLNIFAINAQHLFSPLDAPRRIESQNQKVHWQVAQQFYSEARQLVFQTKSKSSFERRSSPAYSTCGFTPMA